MARVRQFANDLGISKNQAQNLINKGRSRKDGGSQILESVMKPKKYKAGGSNKVNKEDKKKKNKNNNNKKLNPFSRDGKSRTFELTEDMISGRGRMPVIKMEKFNPEDMIGGRGRAPVLKDMDFDPRMTRRNKGGSNVILPKKRPTNLKKKKTSEQIVREINEYELTKSDITASVDRDFSKKVAKQNEEAKKKVKKSNMKNKGGFPDLTGDGNVTKADILKGRGVPGFARGGGMAIQGLGFKGVR
jgi:hypothetical protein